MQKTWLKWRTAYVGAFLVVVTAGIFWPVGGYDFINYDDQEYVTSNPQVQAGLTWKGVGWAFTNGDAANWHPLTWLSLMLDTQLFGVNPGAFHRTNLLFHLANALLLFLALQRLTRALWPSAFVAGLFALHPIHVESVGWISERKDVLSTLFFMLTLLTYARNVECRRPVTSGGPGRTVWYLLTLLCFSLGLMSKPMLVTLPFLLLLLDYWPLSRLEFQPGCLNPRGLLPCLWEKLPFFALSAVSSIVTYRVQAAGEAVAFTSELPLGLRFENAIVSYARYLGKTVWPLDLAILYPHPEHWPVSQIALAAIVVAAISAGAIRFFRDLPFLPVGWFWYLGTLVPVIGLVQVGAQSMADRYTYLPLIGVFIMLSWGALHISARFRLPGNFLPGLAAVMLTACALMSVRQARFWQNSETLFSHAVASTDNNYVAYSNLGAWYMDQGRSQDALTCLQNAFQIVATRSSDPADNNPIGFTGQPPSVDLVTNAAHASVLNNLGLALARVGREKDALPYFRRAIELKPKDPEYLNNFGQALLTQERAPEATEFFQAALRLRPEFGKAHFNLANALAALGRLDEAIGEYRLALKQCAESDEVRTRFGIALAQKGLPDEAIVQFQEAARLSPNSPLTHNNLGNALTERGRNEEAIREFAEALRIQPDYPQGHLNMGTLLERVGRREEAVFHLKESLRLDPGNAAAKEHLRVLGVPVPE